MLWLLLIMLSQGYSLFSQENCGNGIDDDGDGFIDCLDPDCTGNLPDAAAFNTATNKTGGVLAGGANDLSWTQSMNYSGPYSPAIVMSSKPPSYYLSPWPDADWISFDEMGIHGTSVDYYFKTTFLLPCSSFCGGNLADSGTFCLSFDYLSDNSIYEIWVNGVAQSARIKTIPVANPYYNYGFMASGMLSASLCQNWKPGINELIIRVSSGPSYLGLLIQASVKSITPIPPAATISGGGSVCQNDQSPVLTFTGKGKAPFTFSYTINKGTKQTISTTIGNTVSITVPTANPGKFVYTLVDVLDADSHGCPKKVNDSILINVKQKPVADAGADQTICSGSNTVLNATGTVGASYQWINGPATATYSVSPITTATYTVIAYLDGCSSSDNMTVTVNPNPIFVLEKEYAKICRGDSVQLKAAGAFTYDWFPVSGLTTNTGSIVKASPSTSTVYTVTANLNGCKVSKKITVDVQPSPVVNVAPNPVTICQGSSVVLKASGASEYTWSPTLGLSDNKGYIVIASPATTTSYQVTGTSNGCTTSSSVIVNVVPALIVNLGKDQSICPGDSIQLDAKNPGAAYLWSTRDTVQSIVVSSPGIYWVRVNRADCKVTDSVTISLWPRFKINQDETLCNGEIKLNSTVGASSYRWSTGETTPSITIVKPGTYWLTTTVKDCKMTDTIEIREVNAFTLYWPNSFTPNKDGINDIFSFKGDGVKEFELKIFDRWGRQVFGTTDLNVGWDGTAVNGNVAEMGIYAWMVNYKLACTAGKLYTRWGHVCLLKADY